MTVTSTDFFSPRRQFLRVLAHDWRIFSRDIAFGTFYALIGFFGKRGAFQTSDHLLGMPFVLLAVAVGIMAYRVCIAEADPASAAFYFNLPRSRSLTQAAHVALLSAMALGYEALILLAAALRLNLPPGAPGYTIQPHLLLLPFWTLANLVWIVYAPRRASRALSVFSGFVLILLFVSIVTLPTIMVLIASGHLAPGPAFEAALILSQLILITVLLADAFRVGRRVQIGANA